MLKKFLNKIKIPQVDLKKINKIIPYLVPEYWASNKKYGQHHFEIDF